MTDYLINNVTNNAWPNPATWAPWPTVTRTAFEGIPFTINPTPVAIPMDRVREMVADLQLETLSSNFADLTPRVMEPTRKQLKLSVWQRTEECIERWQAKKFASTEFIPGISEGEIRVCDVGIAWVNKITMKVTRILLPEGLSKPNLNLIRYRFRQMGLQVRATGRHEIIEYLDKTTKEWLNERLYYGKPYLLPPYIEKAFAPYKPLIPSKLILTEQLNLPLVEPLRYVGQKEVEEYNRRVYSQLAGGTTPTSSFPYSLYTTGNTYVYNNTATVTFSAER